ncbi:hypothetical protein GCM10022323_07000 [Asaccharospora irregularis DSM 2635]
MNARIINNKLKKKIQNNYRLVYLLLENKKNKMKNFSNHRGNPVHQKYI